MKRREKKEHARPRKTEEVASAVIITMNRSEARSRSDWLLAFVGISAAVLIGILIADSITASRSTTRIKCDMFRYEVPFTCGTNPGALVRVVPGSYATLIHVHNPNAGQVTLWKKITLSFPPAGQEGGFVSEELEDTLETCQTLMVDCEEILSENSFNIPNPHLAPYIIGVAVVKSHKRLTLWAEQTGSVAFPNSQLNQTIPTLSVYRPEEHCFDD